MHTSRTLPLLGLLCLAPLPALAQTAADSPVTLQCGGIGSDESSAMLAESKQQSLTLLYVSSDGHYMSDVQTRIESVKGEHVAEQNCGPIGQVNVAAPGRYKLKASFGDQKQEKTLTLKPRGGQRLVLRWKAE
ncbi:hypothetical protein [Azovibrio restrictus]|uniref:hypothetical protein n=1 Tax=Azovibrio restrictus TaxID=146938 RepID=UPI0026F156FD|nr:hypothetical protein [Azovibrio restrictus]